MEGNQKNRAGAFLPEVLASLIPMLDDAPDFGKCGIDIVFHEGSIDRIVTKTEKSHKLAACRGKQ